MLKSHESELVRATGASTAPQWIEDPRGTRKSFCRDPRGLKIPVRRREHHSPDVIHTAYIDRAIWRACSRDLSCGRARETSSRLWDTLSPSDIINVDDSARDTQPSSLYLLGIDVSSVAILSLILYHFLTLNAFFIFNSNKIIKETHISFVLQYLLRRFSPTSVLDAIMCMKILSRDIVIDKCL